MKAILMTVAVLGLGGCAAEAVGVPMPVGGEGEYLRGSFCGGIAGFPCPEGFTCVDDPSDSCDPDAGGADCGGVCRRSRRVCEHGSDWNYISRSPETCAAILFLCEAGSEPFFNDCGCGCHDLGICDDPDRSYVSRDPDICATVRFFCEEGSTAFFDECGCGCESAPGEPCGPNTCASGEVCCNASCGICTPPDGFCIQLACEPEPLPL